jgi:antitoxin (DNA-binding transcriptional repressor) of toxin-antitoxin stability system
MSTVSLFDAKTHLSRLVEDLVSGQEREVIISRHGKPVARMEPVRPAQTSKRIGIAKGRFKVPDSIDRANPVIAKMFSGKA